MAVAGNTQKRASCQGFSVIEMLVALALGLLLITGMISVFSNNRQSAELNQAMANLQESARFAIDAIARDARMAGFQGCLDLGTEKATIKANNAPTVDYLASAVGASIVVAADNWTPAPPPTYNIPAGIPTPVPGTHALVLQYGSPERVNLSTPMTNFSDDLVINTADDPWGLTGSEIMMISNCDFADIFRLSAMTDNGGTKTLAHAAAANVDGNLSAFYGQEPITKANLMLFNSNVFFVGDTGEVNDAGDPIRALYMQRLPYTTPPIELVQGVENLRVRLGIRDTNGRTRYYLPNTIGALTDSVQSIQIGLLMSSWEHAASTVDEKSYTLAGQTIAANSNIAQANQNALTHPADRRLRLAFNTTINVRNRRH